MLKIIYNSIINILFFIALPLLRIFISPNLLKRRLFKTKPNFIENPVWIHASSVGEVNALKTLVKKLIEVYPDNKFVLSTMTETGQNVARNIDDKLTTFLLPFDLSFVMKDLFAFYQPKLILLMETEFWPNMLWQAYTNNIPVININGRISEKSFPTYSKTKLFWKSSWKAIKEVLAQSNHDRIRFRELGFKNVSNANNLKYAIELPLYNEENSRYDWNLNINDYVITWGSSRPGEERLILSHYKQLKKAIPNLKLIIVPRHLERLKNIDAIIKEMNFTNITSYISENMQSYEILIVDKMGVLTQAYSLSNLCIIGGSFFDFGSHNPLEAAFYKKPIIIGDDYSSCKDSVSKLLKNRGITISNKESLFSDIIKLASNRIDADRLGLNAYKTIEENKESLNNHIEKIGKWIRNV